MPLFVFIGRDRAGAAELRQELRPAHLEHLGPLSAAGRVRFGGPLRDEDGTPRGSVIVLEADSTDAARALCDRDPYVVGGLFETTEVFETLQVFPEA
ncbi:MAG: YciI family protein [Myxococcales bacterium]|nr:YciI family protein [Myxococcales bacterium]